MSTLNPALAIPLGLLILVAGAFAAVAAVRLVRARRKARRRVVERPNSHYTSQLARESDTRNRWHTIALDRIHEINRAEVVRLLAKSEATSVDALRPSERVFMDHMADLAGTPPPPQPRPASERSPQELRPRTA